MSPAPYVPRLIDATLEDLFSQLPALLVVGPRACGKTTSARRLAETVVRLDVSAEAAAFRFDPDAALSAMPEPVLFDEWQEVPELMGAVRRAVDADPRPGRFLLTGSAGPRRGNDAWSGIGRVVNVKMYGLTVREALGDSDRPGFLERLARRRAQRLPRPGRPSGYSRLRRPRLAGRLPRAAPAPHRQGQAGLAQLLHRPTRDPAMPRPWARPETRSCCAATSRPCASTMPASYGTGRSMRPPASAGSPRTRMSACSRSCSCSRRSRPGATTACHD